jgi:diguanylate cyclase (GGDEF)-like protein/PAS domain S-box-containing protein
MREWMMEMKKHANRIHSLYKSIIRRNGPVENIFKTILEEGLKAFDLSLGIISHIEGERYTILAASGTPKEITIGTTLELKNTYCQKVVRERAVISVENAGASLDYNAHPVYTNMKLESYISAPIFIRGMVWGTLNFSSKKIKKTPFNDDDYNFIELMADGISSSIEIEVLNREKESMILSLKKSNETLESIFENSTIGMALVSTSGQWVKVNHSLINMLGYNKDYLLSVTFQEITHPDDLKNDLKLLDSLSKGLIPSYQLEKRYITANGVYIWILLSVSLVRNQNGGVKYYIAQIQSIDERKKMEIGLKEQKDKLREINLELERNATSDYLTGVANRRKFMDWIENEKQRSEKYLTPLSIAILDVDYFKSYNDEYGHLEGDIALQCIAMELSLTLTRRDRIARFGGEEFIILFPRLNECECLSACERLRSHIEGMISLKRKITISIGAVTYFPDKITSVTFDDLLKSADAKLYEAKNAGRNRVKACRFFKMYP